MFINNCLQFILFYTRLNYYINIYVFNNISSFDILNNNNVINCRKIRYLSNRGHKTHFFLLLLE